MRGNESHGEKKKKKERGEECNKGRAEKIGVLRIQGEKSRGVFF